MPQAIWNERILAATSNEGPGIDHLQRRPNALQAMRPSGRGFQSMIAEISIYLPGSIGNSGETSAFGTSDTAYGIRRWTVA